MTDNNIIERGVDATKLNDTPVYQKILNTLIDESVQTCASSKMEDKDKREAAWHRYQSIVSMHGTFSAI